MGLITTELQIKLTPQRVKWYESKGYELPRKANGKYNLNTYFTVQVEDLQPKSSETVECSCDYCGKIIQCSYCDYNIHINEITPKIACKDCIHLKTAESVRQKYNVNNIFCLEETKEKIKTTNLKNLGCEYPTQSDVVKQKVRESVQSKYNVDSVMKVPEIKERVKQTNITRYGFPNAMQNPDILNKLKNTLYNNYQVYNPSQCFELRQKANQSLYEHGTVNTSRQQKYICDLYNMKLNYPIVYWNVDMYDDSSNLIVEVDCGGHDLAVRLGNITKEEFEQKEIVRNNVIKRNGYKMMRIISKTDKLPLDNILLQILDDAKQYFSNYPNHSWITFNIDEGIVESAEFKRSYFYGQLRRVKASDLKSA